MKYRFQCKCPRPNKDFGRGLTEADLRTCIIESDECNEYQYTAIPIRCPFHQFFATHWVRIDDREDEIWSPAQGFGVQNPGRFLDSDGGHP